ncbi:MAG: peptide ABC transporter substrate-binding protein [Candidatus Methylacidiphilales bacterium]|nr:peptide ABC transporter substrate-binding protein [Candidatus Methylacidiphilales bacterium]
MPPSPITHRLSSVIPKRSEGRTVAPSEGGLPKRSKGHAEALAKAGVLSLTLLLVLNACTGRPKDVDLIFINGPEPQSIDPAVLTGQPDGRISSSLFEGLTTRNAAGEIIPGMAERWEHDGSHRVYTFHLRQAQWSNGDPVTAADFAGSWRRILEPATACPYAEILFFIRGAEAYQKGELKDWSQVGIQVLDDRTLRVELRAPTPFFPQVAAFVTYQPVHLPSVERFGESWSRPAHIVSNGPYLLKNWKFNDRIELLRNERYWRKDQVRLRRIDALSVTKANTALNLYLTGQADLIIDKSLIPAVLIEKLRPRPDFHAFTFLANYFYRFNTTRKPFHDPRVRRAFSAAIDRDRIVQRITKAGELPATSFVPPGLTGYAAVAGLTYSPEKARQELADAGYPGGRGFPRTELLYNHTDLNEQVAVEIQAMWKEILGVDVGLRRQEWATYFKSLDELDYDIARSSWVGDYPDPLTFLDCFVTGRGNNRTGWSHAAYDRLIEKSNYEADPVRRFALLGQAEEILVRQESPIAPVYYFTGIMFYDAGKLGGIEGNLLDEHPLREMYWK